MLRRRQVEILKTGTMWLLPRAEKKKISEVRGSETAMSPNKEIVSFPHVHTWDAESNRGKRCGLSLSFFFPHQYLLSSLTHLVRPS